MQRTGCLLIDVASPVVRQSKLNDLLCIRMILKATLDTVLLRINAISRVLAAMLLCVSCEKPQPKQLTPAFYFWQTTFRLAPNERKLLHRLAVQKLYIRFFDVDWDPATQGPQPKAVIRFAEMPNGLSLVPVVFITNQTLIRCPASAIPTLAENIERKIRLLRRENRISINEIQLDCDWSASSRSNYFRLLREIKKRFSGTLSATIRLHQIKYPDQTGIPPVDRGMLMVYNMADWKRPATRNSIYDLEVAGRYLGSLNAYKLPLDVVLPLFRWTVVYRSNRFLTFLNNVDASKLRVIPALKPVAENRFEAQRDTTVFGFSVRRGDLFRAESVQPADLEQGRAVLLSKIPNQKLTFALYHLDSTVTSPYSDAFLHSLFRPGP
ncbi:hypothetical protein ACO2Q8_18060 [Larkinella sp. VNQ87]|uniref:hypothetical protein n=1 Tax=Larkinella sp. VNQ87 TaxID=3400921 RepID=UPI003BFDDA42